MTLITDRTQADVDAAKELRKKRLSDMTEEERTSWLSGMKGAYNAMDLNRVQEAMEEIAEILTGYGYPTAVKRPILTKNRDYWEMGDIADHANRALYLNNVQIIRDALGVLETTPQVPPDMERFTWQQANEIEQILVDVNYLIEQMALAFMYSGEMYCGEV